LRNKSNGTLTVEDAGAFGADAEATSCEEGGLGTVLCAIAGATALSMRETQQNDAVARTREVNAHLDAKILVDRYPF